VFPLICARSPAVKVTSFDEMTLPSTLPTRAPSEVTSIQARSLSGSTQTSALKSRDLSNPGPYDYRREGRLARLKQDLPLQDLHDHGFRSLTHRDVRARIEGNALMTKLTPLRSSIGAAQR
jgi:hypothetical protein